jgi:hypothetical protein
MAVEIINSERSLAEVTNRLIELWHAKKYLRLSIKTGKDRSLDQNAISHCWYEQIAKEVGGSAEQVKRECKLLYGVPILRASDAEFSDWCVSALDWLGYEEKVEAMKWIDVTSLMSVEQMADYLTAMQADHAQAGIILTGKP